MNIMPITTNTNYKNQAFGMRFSPKAKENLTDLANRGFIGLREAKLLEELGSNGDEAVFESIKMGCINIPSKYHRLESNYYPEVKINQGGNVDTILEELISQPIRDKVYNLLHKVHVKYVGAKENVLGSIARLPE